MPHRPDRKKKALIGSFEYPGAAAAVSNESLIRITLCPTAPGVNDNAHWAESVAPGPLSFLDALLCTAPTANGREKT